MCPLVGWLGRGIGWLQSWHLVNGSWLHVARVVTKYNICVSAFVHSELDAGVRVHAVGMVHQSCATNTG